MVFLTKSQTIVLVKVFLIMLRVKKGYRFMIDYIAKKLNHFFSLCINYSLNEEKP